MESSILTLSSETLPVQALPHPKSTHSQRNTTIELARLLAALGVIAAHIPSYTNKASWFIEALSPLRVPFFYSLSLFLFVSSLPQTTTQRIASRIWHRTLIPYLSWTVLYEVSLLAKMLLLHDQREVVWWRVLLYGESAVQMYFLPTLLMMQAVALGLYLLLTPSINQRFTGWLLVGGGLVYYVWGAYHHCFGIPSFNYAVAYIIYILMAFWLAFGKKMDSRGRRMHAIAGACMVLVAVCCNKLDYRLPLFGYPLVLPLGGVGALLFTSGLVSQWRSGWLLTATSFTFGIYLCHPLFIEMFEFLMQHVYHTTIVYTSSVKMLEVIVVFIASGILILVLRCVKTARRLLLGER